MPLHRVEFVAHVEGIHHLLASAVGVGVDDAHDGIHTFVEGRVRWIRHQLIVLDEINSGFAKNFHQVRRLLRRHADARLDDRADERAALDLRQLATTAHPKLRPAKVLREGLRQFHVHQLQPSERRDLVKISLNGRDERGQVVAHVFQRPRHDDFCAVEFSRGRLCSGQAGHGDSFEWGDFLHARGEALFQLLGFAGHFHERAGRLFARQSRGGLLDGERCFDEIRCLNAFHGWAHRRFEAVRAQCEFLSPFELPADDR